jgi:non-homologous end joining protein Ku
MDEIDVIDTPLKVDAKELSLGKTLVDNLSAEKFDPGQYSDTYAKELEKLIEAKSKDNKSPLRKRRKSLKQLQTYLRLLKRVSR